MGRYLLFGILLLSSGFCGISYETLYGRILGNLIGDQFLVSASILLTFLLGIGCGALFAHRLWRHLWLLEAGLGVYAAAFALGSGPLDSIIYGLGSPLLACLLCLSVPSFLIGTSLPLFAGYMSRIKAGPVFSGAYAIYNLGAAATVLVVDFWLLRTVGIQLTTLCIAVINGLVALCLITVFRDIREDPPPARDASRLRVSRPLLVALVLASVGSAIFQLVGLKLAEALVGPFRDTFALVLCVILLGIGVGSALVHWLRVGLATILFANLVGLA